MTAESAEDQSAVEAAGICGAGPLSAFHCSNNPTTIDLQWNPCGRPPTPGCGASLHQAGRRSRAISFFSSLVSIAVTRASQLALIAASDMFRTSFETSAASGAERSPSATACTMSPMAASASAAFAIGRSSKHTGRCLPRGRVPLFGERDGVLGELPGVIVEQLLGQDGALVARAAGAAGRIAALSFFEGHGDLLSYQLMQAGGIRP